MAAVEWGMTDPSRRVRSHRDLIVWQRGLELVDETYSSTDRFPPREQYGITAQMRAAAVSIPANIAEGHGRHTTREFLRFLAIANGSLRELDTYYEVSLRRKYATPAELGSLGNLMDEVGRMLSGLRSALTRKAVKTLPPAP